MAKVDSNGNYVYPKVPRKYWKAVVMACGIIRDRETFNVAIERASSHFNVDPDELKKHVVARTQAGCEYSRMKNAVIKPESPSFSESENPSGYCKDCEYCRVDGVLFKKLSSIPKGSRPVCAIRATVEVRSHGAEIEFPKLLVSKVRSGKIGCSDFSLAME